MKLRSKSVDDFIAKNKNKIVIEEKKPRRYKYYKRNSYTKTKADLFCKNLVENKGLLLLSCKKTGICYGTYRKWCDEQPYFKKKVEESQLEGDLNGKEIAVTTIFDDMKEKHAQSAQWWLSHKFSKEFSIQNDLKIETEPDIIFEFGKKNQSNNE